MIAGAVDARDVIVIEGDASSGRQATKRPLRTAGWRALVLIIVATTASVGAAEPKRVLLVQSFGSAATPFTARLVAFETELIAKMGDRVDLDEVSLDMARAADRDMQEATVNYLHNRQAKWQPDLVVPIGSSATIFVANHRDQLFPETPVLYVVDRRLLPPGALEKNAAYVGQEYDLRGVIEDMLQVAPATKNIDVVVGATPLEHSWQEAFQTAAEPLADRINFTYYSDLSFEQMKERASTLPPDSYIFFLLLVRDATGVALNSDEALQRLCAVTRAPINSLFDHQLGMGTVGGRLYQSEGVGKEAADVAVRILDGEPASSITPRVFERLPARYDWRALRRWKISEKRLPAGSTVLFREPTVWQRHRAWIITGISICILQALLITVVLFNLFRRRRAERSLTESEGRFERMADAAPIMIWTAGEDKLCTFFNKAWLAFTGRRMEQELGNGWSEGVHPDDFENCVQTYVTAFEARKPFMMKYRLRRHDGEYRFITDSGAPRFGLRGNFRGYVGACVDVTDLLEQQKKVHEFEERVALAADAAHLGVWEFNTVTNELWLSDKARELFEFPFEGPVTYPAFRNRAHPEGWLLRDTAFKRAIETQGGYEIEYGALLPDGTVRWISERARCLSDENGALTRLIGVSMDITPHKQAQDVFRLAATASHLGVWNWNEVANTLIWDGPTRQLFGVSPDANITIDTFYKALHPDDAERVKHIWRQALELRLPYQIEFRAQRPDGTIRWVDARGRGSYDDEGKPLSMAGVVLDITARKEAEELFRLVTEAAPSGILLANDKGRIVLVNAHVEKLFGYKREELIGKPIEVLVPERFATEYVAHRTQFLAAPKVRPADVVGEVSARRKDGTEFPVEVGLNPIQTPHGTLVLATVVDISQRKLDEEQTRKTREDINRLSRISLLGEMTASIAHELNQPLSGITSNANAGQRFIDRGNADIEMLREIMVDIAADGRRASDIINNIRNMIKKGTASRKRIKMNDVVKDVTHMVRPDIFARSCQLELSLEKDLPVVEGDPIQIQQVLINLVANACDAMRTVPPSRRNVEIATNRNGHGGIRVSVRDHGSGISDEVSEHLFDQFFTTKEQGLGMGLAIVRSIIEAHGGKIEAENVKGGGARFRFTLPPAKKISK
jgi:PAS domain S-box-containing protein